MYNNNNKQKKNPRKSGRKRVIFWSAKKWLMKEIIKKNVRKEWKELDNSVQMKWRKREIEMKNHWRLFIIVKPKFWYSNVFIQTKQIKKKWFLWIIIDSVKFMKSYTLWGLILTKWLSRWFVQGHDNKKASLCFKKKTNNTFSLKKRTYRIS